MILYLFKYIMFYYMDNNEMIEQQISDIEEKFKENKILFISIDGVYERDLETLKTTTNIDEFLYDINRLSEVIITNARNNPKSQRWVNDIALVNALKYMKTSYDKLLKHYKNVMHEYTKLFDEKYGDRPEKPIKKENNENISTDNYDVFVSGKNIGV